MVSYHALGLVGLPAGTSWQMQGSGCRPIAFCPQQVRVPQSLSERGVQCSKLVVPFRFSYCVDFKIAVSPLLLNCQKNVTTFGSAVTWHRTRSRSSSDPPTTTTSSLRQTGPTAEKKKQKLSFQIALRNNKKKSLKKKSKKKREYPINYY